MLPSEMRAQANKRLADGADDMLLTIMRSREPRDTVFLTRAGSPKGVVCGTFDSPDGRVRVAAFFKCADVLAWLDKMERALLPESEGKDGR